MLTIYPNCSSVNLHNSYSTYLSPGYSLHASIFYSNNSNNNNNNINIKNDGSNSNNLKRDLISQNIKPLNGGNGNGQRETDALNRLIVGCIFEALIIQPCRTCYTLLQLGYEAAPPYHLYSIDSSTGSSTRNTYLPSVFGYMTAYVRNFGWRALYAGVGSNILQLVIDSALENLLKEPAYNFMENIINYNRTQDTTVFKYKRLIVYCLSHTALCTVKSVFTYPFFVCGTLAIVRCVEGVESLWVGQQMWTVIKDAGIGALMSGVFSSWIFSMLNTFLVEFTLESYLAIRAKLGYPVAQNDPNITLLRYCAILLISTYTYPFNLVSTIMILNKISSVNYTQFSRMPVFINWIRCLRHLYDTGLWYRGSSFLFRRHVSSTTIMT